MSGRVANPNLTTIREVIGYAESETVILDIARYQLPVVLGAMLLASGIAIILSTGNTYLMVPSTNASRDIYQRYINPNATENQLILFQRICIVGFGAVGLLLQTQFQQILELALYAYSLLGGSITPALLASFFWKRVTPQGGVACLAGGIVTLVSLVLCERLGFDLSLKIMDSEFYLSSSEYIVIPTVLVTTSLLILVSLITPASPANKWRPFFNG
jgi:SSS family solute:Na+ symporter/sodium/proline symporter